MLFRSEFSLVERGAAVSGIGNGAIRRRIVAMCTKALWTTLVHPAAWVDPAASLGSGTVICAGVVLQPGVFVDTAQTASSSRMKLS